jgi:ribonuclease HI
MALKMVEKNKFTLITDSKYAIGCCSEWIDNWRKRDFEGIKNKELVIELDKHLNNKTIKFLHVYGHTGNKYNEICDMLAKKYT